MNQSVIFRGVSNQGDPEPGSEARESRTRRVRTGRPRRGLPMGRAKAGARTTIRLRNQWVTTQAGAAPQRQRCHETRDSLSGRRQGRDRRNGKFIAATQGLTALQDGSYIFCINRRRSIITPDSGATIAAACTRSTALPSAHQTAMRSTRCAASPSRTITATVAAISGHHRRCGQFHARAGRLDEAVPAARAARDGDGARGGGVDVRPVRGRVRSDRGDMRRRPPGFIECRPLDSMFIEGDPRFQD